MKRRFGDRTVVTQETTSSDVTSNTNERLFSETRWNEYCYRLGAINMTGNTLTNISKPVANHDAVNKAYRYVDDNVGGVGPNKVSKSGNTMSGDLNIVV